MTDLPPNVILTQYHCNAMSKREWWDAHIRGEKLSVLCGAAVEENMWWDFAGTFVTDEYKNYPSQEWDRLTKRKFERCVDCEKHPDLALLLLRELDE